MTNLSYQGRKFDAGRLVVPVIGNEGVGVVLPASKYQPDSLGRYAMHYWVRFPEGGGFVSIDFWGEDALREPTWWEFAYHRNPEDGGWQIGNNPLSLFIYGLVVGSLCSFGGFYWGASSVIWEAAASLPLALLLTWYAIGTRRNLKNKSA